MKNPRAQSKADKWLQGSVTEIRGPRNYIVKIGSIEKLVNADHLVKTSEENPLVNSELPKLLMPQIIYPVVPNNGTKPAQNMLNENPCENSNIAKSVDNSGKVDPVKTKEST